MALQCGKNLEQESVKVSQKDMKSLMKKGRGMLGNLKKSNAFKQLDIKKLEKIPKKLNEVVITGYTNKVTVPDDTFLIGAVYGKKTGSGMKFLILDYTYDKENKIVSTTEKVNEFIVTALVPDGTEEVNLKKEVEKLQGAGNVNDFISKAKDLQLKFGSSTPTPKTSDVEEVAENTATINLSDKPIKILKVLIMTDNNTFYGGTRNFKLEDTVVTLTVPGEPNKLRVVKKIKVKYSVPGTSSVAMGSKGNFDINQILAKVTKDKNFTTNDIKTIDNAKVKGLMGSYQKDIGKGLNNLDTSKMTGQEKSLISQFKSGISPDGNLNMNALNFNKIFNSAGDIAQNSAKGKVEETALKKMLSGDLSGAFSEGVKLNQMGSSSKIPAIPKSFDLTKLSKDPTTALTSLLNITTARPSSPILRTVDSVKSVGGGNNSNSITLSKPLSEIVKVEGRKAGTNFFGNANYKKNETKIITSELYEEIKVTYKTPAPEIKPGEAFGTRKLDTCKDLPDIKVLLPKLSIQDLTQGKTLSDVSSVVPLSKAKKPPVEKPKSNSVDLETLKFSANVNYKDYISKKDLDTFHEYLDLLEDPIFDYFAGEIGRAKIARDDLRSTSIYKRLKLLFKQNKGKKRSQLVAEGLMSQEDNTWVKTVYAPVYKKYRYLLFGYNKINNYGISDSIKNFISLTAEINVFKEVIEIAKRGDEGLIAAFKQGEVNAMTRRVDVLRKVTIDFEDETKITPAYKEEIRKALEIANFNFPSEKDGIKYKNAFIKRVFSEEEVNQAVVYDLQNNYKVN